MQTILCDLVIPAAAGAVSAGAAALAMKRAKQDAAPKDAETLHRKRAPELRPFAALGAAALLQILFFLLLDGLLALFAVRAPYAGMQSGISVTARIITALLCDAAILAGFFAESLPLRKFLRRSAAAAAVLLLAECFVFNGKSLTKAPRYERTQAVNIIANAEFTNLTGGEGLMQLSGGDAELECHPEQDVRAICFIAEKRNPNTMLHAKIEIKDSNFADDWKTADDRWFAGNGELCVLNLDPYAPLYAVKLSFPGLPEKNVTLLELDEANAQPFRFMNMRYLLLLLAAVIVIAVQGFSLHRVIFSGRRRWHKLLLTAVILLCTVSPLLFLPFSKSEPYKPNVIYPDADSYYLTFDAFWHGQVHLRVPVDETLSAMPEEQVYDASLRNAAEAVYRWDMAFRDGKYYSYFGVVPVLVLYFPYYWITGRPPLLENATMFFAVIAAALTCFALLAAVQLLVRKPNLLMLCMSLPAAVAAEGIFYCVHARAVYVLPVASGICFLMLCLWLALLAVRTKTKWKAYLEYGFSGLALGLCAGSRPTLAISAAVLIPLFLGVLRSRKRTRTDKLICTAAFALPLLAAVAGLLFYNYLRFGSPLDFGTEYQLTVSNIHANKLRLYAIPDAVYHYLLQPMMLHLSYPFVTLTAEPIGQYERYRFAYLNCGVFAVPFFAAALILLRTSLSGSHAQTPFRRVTALQKRAFLLTGFVVICIVGWMDFCLAGSGMQYVFDLTPVMSICAAVILMTAADPESRLRYRLSAAACILTVCVIALLLIGNRESALHRNFPLLYEEAESMLAFWH